MTYTDSGLLLIALGLLLAGGGVGYLLSGFARRSAVARAEGEGVVHQMQPELMNESVLGVLRSAGGKCGPSRCRQDSQQTAS